MKFTISLTTKVLMLLLLLVNSNMISAVRKSKAKKRKTVNTRRKAKTETKAKDYMYWLKLVLGAMSQLPLVSAYAKLVNAALNKSLNVVCDGSTRDRSSYLPKNYSVNFSTKAISKDFIDFAVGEAKDFVNGKVAEKLKQKEAELTKKPDTNWNVGDFTPYIEDFDEEGYKTITSKKTDEEQLTAMIAWVNDKNNKKEITDCISKYKDGKIKKMGEACEQLEAHMANCISSGYYNQDAYIRFMKDTYNKETKDVMKKIRKVYYKEEESKWRIVYADDTVEKMESGLFNSWEPTYEKYTAEVSKQCTSEEISTLNQLLDIKSLESFKLGEKKQTTSEMFQIGFYLLKQMWLCSSTIVAKEISKEIFFVFGSWIANTLLNILTGFVYYLLRIGYWILKTIYYIYQASKATKDSTDEAEKWGKALGAGIRIILVVFGVAKRKKIRTLRKLRKL